MAVGVNVHETQQASGGMSQERRRRSSCNPLDPGRCLVLVPYAGSVAPYGERALRKLERRGYEVRRGERGADAADDQGLNRMVTKALIDGFEETMWIAGNVGFQPDDVDRLRTHGLPITCGIYNREQKCSISRHILPGGSLKTPEGKSGLMELSYSGINFLHVRREVYQAIQLQLDLPACNERSRSPIVPFFYPILTPCEDGHRYLAESYAFCFRARQCGFRIIADSKVKID